MNAVGGGIGIEMHRSQGVVVNTTIVDCIAHEHLTNTGILTPTYGGGLSAILRSGSNLLVQHVTTRRNWARIGGGIAIDAADSQAHVTSSIMYGNFGTPPHKEMWNNGGIFSYNCIRGNTIPGMFNIDQDPDILTNLHTLSPTSPCIDAGNPVLPPDLSVSAGY